jgi:hypothetical protein
VTIEEALAGIRQLTAQNPGMWLLTPMGSIRADMANSPCGYCCPLVGLARTAGIEVIGALWGDEAAAAMGLPHDDAISIMDAADKAERQDYRYNLNIRANLLEACGLSS